MAGLVYIGAVAPDVGETVQDQLDKYPSDIFSRVEVADGRAWMLPNGTEFFCGDLSEEEQKLVWATHLRACRRPLSRNKSYPEHPVEVEAELVHFDQKDHTVHPDLQRWVSKRMGATVTEVESSHVPMLSKPDVVIDVIRKAAAAVIGEERKLGVLRLGAWERSPPKGVSPATRSIGSKRPFCPCSLGATSATRGSQWHALTAGQ